MTASLFPWVRMLHILFAALWLGAGALLTFYLLPTLRQLGPAGGLTLQTLERRGLPRFMGAIGGLTILSGLGLYWGLTAGFNAGAIESPTGLVFGLGGLAGLLAAAIGGGVIARSIRQIDLLIGSNQAAGFSEEILALQRRISWASRLALALLLIALVAMTLGHSV